MSKAYSLIDLFSDSALLRHDGSSWREVSDTRARCVLTRRGHRRYLRLHLYNRGALCRSYWTASGPDLRYVAFLTPEALASVHTALGGHGTIDSLTDVHRLLGEVTGPRDGCVILDPALITPAAAETIAASVAGASRSIIAFSSVTPAAIESGVILARLTPACFVFRGIPNERSALEQALLLATDCELGSVLLGLLQYNLDRLPPRLRDRLTTMFRSGEGPRSPDALAAATSITRRSLDRFLSESGLVSARLLVEGPRITSGYRAITASRIPLKDVATMLGYSALRTLDAQLRRLMDTTGRRLRSRPLSCNEAAARLAQRLTLTLREAGLQGRAGS